MIWDDDMHQCYAVGQTAEGDELRCCLNRNHRELLDHWDAVRDRFWVVPGEGSWAVVITDSRDLQSVG